MNDVFSFISYKALGPDGLYPFFFQKYWHIVGSKVINLCRNVFKTQKIPPNINDTYLCLFSKINNAINLKKNFRPISLCNTIYKIITKIIANRIKSFLNFLISQEQASFFKNRQAMISQLSSRKSLRN